LERERNRSKQQKISVLFLFKVSFSFLFLKGTKQAGGELSFARIEKRFWVKESIIWAAGRLQYGAAQGEKNICDF